MGVVALVIVVLVVLGGVFIFLFGYMLAGDFS